MPEIERLIHELDSADWKQRRNAIEALAEIGAGAAPPLCAAAQAGGLAQRAGALKALGQIRDLRALPVLISALEAPDGSLVDVAADALADLGDRRGVPALRRALRRRNVPRNRIGEALCRLASTVDVPWLCRVVERDWQGLTLPAARALARVKDSRAIVPLGRVLQRGNPRYRANLIGSLAAIGTPAAADAICRQPTEPDLSIVAEARIEALGRMGADAVAPLVAALWNQRMDPTVAKDALVRIGPPTVPALCEALRAQHWLSGPRVARVLGRIGDCAAIRHLVIALRAPSAELAGEAVLALSAIGDPSSVVFLRPLLDDSRPSVRARAAVAMVELGASADVRPRLLVGALQDQVVSLRKRAAAALCRAATEAPSPTLRGALPALRRVAARWSLESEAVKGASRRAIAAILTATDHLSALPLPSAGSACDPAILPRPEQGTGRIA